MVLQSQHGQSNFLDLILVLKDVAVLIFIKIALQITAAKYLIKFLSFNSMLTKGVCKVYLSLKLNKFLKSPTDRSLATLYISVAKWCIF